MFRVAICTKSGSITAFNAETKEAIDNWLLAVMEKEEIKYYKIIDIKTKEVIETEKGKK